MASPVTGDPSLTTCGSVCGRSAETSATVGNRQVTGRNGAVSAVVCRSARPAGDEPVMSFRQVSRGKIAIAFTDLG